jgi:2-polyprenyl-3-methyl-5-hydroxy-6-metoxy-1,4-benzoquinol methylase
MTPILQYILDYLEQRDRANTARIKLRLVQENDIYLSKVSSFFERYKGYIESTGRTIDYGLDCYLKLQARMIVERIEFVRSGKYASSTFADVERQIYLNPDAFEYHMHGLVFAQLFWPEQSARFKFFSDHIKEKLAKGGFYLEIGGGHGLYIIEAISSAPQNTEFSLVDISPSSMELAKGVTSGLPIDFRLMNIFELGASHKFDFITMGEVLEHVENPLQLLNKVRELLSPDGCCFISTPANAPTIDHIYLFNSADEIRTMLNQAGFKICHEKVVIPDNFSEERAKKSKVPVMFAAFVR